MNKTPFNQLASCHAGGLGAGRRVAKWIQSHPNQINNSNPPYCYVQPTPTNSDSNYYLTCVASQSIPRSIAWSPQNGIPFSVLYQNKYPGSTSTPTPTPTINTEGSLLFDSTNQNSYLSLSPSISVDENDFTIECWVNLTSIVNNSTSCAILGGDDTTVGNLVINLYSSIQTNSPRGNGIYIYPQNENAATNGNYFQYNFNSNTWYYLTIVRKYTSNPNTSNLCVFVNGVSIEPDHHYGSKKYANINVIGSWNTQNVAYSNSNVFPGYISSLRIVIGTAIYDPTLSSLPNIPPSQSLPYVTNTKLLLPTYENNPFLVLPSTQSITNTSAVSSSNEDPFNATTPGSLLFDGSGSGDSFITIVDNSFTLTSNFTI